MNLVFHTAEDTLVLKKQWKSVAESHAVNLDISQQAENKTKLELLLKLRVGAILGQCAIIWPAVELEWLERSMVGPFCMVIALLGSLSLFTLFGLKYRLIKATQAFVFFQVSMDALALSLLLRFSGGPWNPFVSLLLFHGALGAFVLRGAWLTYFIGFIVWCLALVYWNPTLPILATANQIPNAVLFPVQTLLLLLFVGLVIWANHLLEQHKKTIFRVREEKNQIDRLRAFGVIATGFSHEFATPLATLKLKLSRLKNKEHLSNDADLETAIQAASQAEQSLKRLLNQKFLPERADFLLLELTSSLETIFNHWDEDSKIVEFVHQNTKIWLKAPLLSFHQMIIDLLDNAHRANKEKNNSKIKVTIFAEPNFVSLEILDMGPGFPQWIIDHLGTPFFSTRSDSSGLGLYHATILCQAMGGVIRLQNNKVIGAKVSMRWPRLQG